MSEPVLPEDPFPEGWCLGDESWRFHRQFFVRVGRPAAFAEYTAIISQIRYKIAAKLDRYHYRVTLRDGATLIVSGSWHRLNGVEPTGWTPKAEPSAKAAPTPASAAPPPEPQAQARAPPKTIAEPPPRQPLRASTLTLGNPAAARALAERLRRAGIPVERTSP